MEPKNYVCLLCGARHGEPVETDEKRVENWYWKIFIYGRVGPFCSLVCSRNFFNPPHEAQYTIDEFEKLYFLRWRVLNGHAHLPIIEA